MKLKDSIIIILLVVIAIGIGVLVGIKLTEDKNDNLQNNNGTTNNDQVKELSLSDSLVTSLKYPENVFELGYRNSWDYKDININQLGRKNMMYTAQQKTNNNLKFDELYGDYYEYSAVEIEKNFKMVFGPDTSYHNGDVGEGCMMISVYESNNNVYKAYTNCGGNSIVDYDYVTKKYKAKQDGDFIYVYEYAQHITIDPENEENYDGPSVVKILDSNGNAVKTISYDNYKNVIYDMMDKGQVKTYKWTFKKQSDGKYYFYSGNWEN